MWELAVELWTSGAGDGARRDAGAELLSDSANPSQKEGNAQLVELDQVESGRVARILELEGKVTKGREELLEMRTMLLEIRQRLLGISVRHEGQVWITSRDGGAEWGDVVDLDLSAILAAAWRVLDFAHPLGKTEGLHLSPMDALVFVTERWYRSLRPHVLRAPASFMATRILDSTDVPHDVRDRIYKFTSAHSVHRLCLSFVCQPPANGLLLQRIRKMPFLTEPVLETLGDVRDAVRKYQLALPTLRHDELDAAIERCAEFESRLNFIIGGPWEELEPRHWNFELPFGTFSLGLWDVLSQVLAPSLAAERLLHEAEYLETLGKNKACADEGTEGGNNEVAKGTT